MELPFVRPEVRQVNAAPAAKGPRAAVQSGTLRASSTTVLPARSRHGSGSDVMQVSESASSRHSTTVSPKVFSVMRSVPKQVATLPTAKPPSATVHTGMAATRARPSVSARSWQGSGTVAHTGCGTGVDVGSSQRTPSVTVPVPESKPKATRRHSTMLAPSVDSVMDPVARQVAALPTAKGPRATAQTATSATRSRPLESSRLTHASGRVVMHLPSRAVKMQSAMSDPTVKIERDVARQVAMFPAANGPRAAVQVRITGAKRRPLVVSRSWQPAGRATSQKEVVEVGTGMHSDAEVSTDSGVVELAAIDVVASSEVAAAVVVGSSEEMAVVSTAVVVSISVLETTSEVAVSEEIAVVSAA